MFQIALKEPKSCIETFLIRAHPHVSFAGLGKSQESQAVSSRKITEEQEPDFLKTSPAPKLLQVSPRKVTSDFPRHPKTQSPDKIDLVPNIFNLNS